MLPVWSVDRYGSGLNELRFSVFTRIGQNVMNTAIVYLKSRFMGCTRFCLEPLAVGFFIDLPSNGLRSVT